MNSLLDWQKKLTKTTDELSKQLDSIRQQIIDCNDEVDWLQSAPLPLDDALGNIDGFINENSEALEVVQFFHDRRMAGEVFEVEAKHVVTGPLRVVDDVVSGHPFYTVDISTIFCGLFPELVKTALVAQVTKAAENIEAGPPRAERAGLIKAAKERRLALEVEEEALISQAEEAGLSGFYRRHDCNPEIVLMRAT